MAGRGKRKTIGDMDNKRKILAVMLKRIIFIAGVLSSYQTLQGDNEGITVNKKKMARMGQELIDITQDISGLFNSKE